MHIMSVYEMHALPRLGTLRPIARFFIEQQLCNLKPNDIRHSQNLSYKTCSLYCIPDQTSWHPVLWLLLFNKQLSDDWTQADAKTKK